MSSILLVRVPSSRFINSLTLTRYYPQNNFKTTANFDLKSRQGAASVFFARQQISDVYIDEETRPFRETDSPSILSQQEKNQVSKTLFIIFLTNQVR